MNDLAADLSMITKLSQLDQQKKYTYTDYLSWKFEEMVELIRGKIFLMSPAPNLEHQRLSGKLFNQIYNFLSEQQCEVFHPPFDVSLPLPPDKVEEDKIDTVVQPDITIVCDPNKLVETGCHGAPDWIVEILSPSSSKKDLTDKFEVYEHALVPEYWVIHPHEHTLLIFTLKQDGKYTGSQRPFVKGDVVSPNKFPGLLIELDKLFS